MTVIQLQFPEDVSQKLGARAAAAGRDVQAYVADLVERDLRRPTYAETFKPLQDAMAGHGMTEEESLAFFEAEREAMWAERRAKQSADPAGHDAPPTSGQAP